METENENPKDHTQTRYRMNDLKRKYQTDKQINAQKRNERETNSEQKKKNKIVK